MNEHYHGLPTLSYGIRWLEELVAILSKPFLMIGFIISMVDLLTQGRLLNNAIIYYGWAVIQAIAVDACFFVTWHRVKVSWQKRQIVAFLGYSLLGIALGIVAWAAMDLQSLEQVLGITSRDALARLNLNPVMLTHLRSAVAVILGGVVAMIAPEHQVMITSRSAQSEGDHLLTQEIISEPVSTAPIGQTEGDHLLTQEVITAQVSAQGNREQEEAYYPDSEVITWQRDHLYEPFLQADVDVSNFTFSEHLIGVQTDHQNEIDTDELNTLASEQPVSTAKQKTPSTRRASHQKKTTNLHVINPANIEQVIRKLLTDHPASSNREIARMANCSPNTVKKWRAIGDQEKQATA